jgi:hypothetical protein
MAPCGQLNRNKGRCPGLQPHSTAACGHRGVRFVHYQNTFTLVGNLIALRFMADHRRIRVLLDRIALLEESPLCGHNQANGIGYVSENPEAGDYSSESDAFGVSSEGLGLPKCSTDGCRCESRMKRMHRIIRRQSVIIQSMERMFLGRSSSFGTGGMRTRGLHDGVEEDQTGVPMIHASFPPAWDVDMDDITRQLAELGQSITRVENSTQKLRLSTISEPSSTYRDRQPTHTKDAHHATQAAADGGSSVLARIYHGTA